MAAKREELTRRIKGALGIEELSPHYERLLEWDIDYLERYAALMLEASQARTDGVLSRKCRELITLAANAALQNWSGTRVHIVYALDHGATPREVLETLETTLPAAGVPALLYGSQILEEVLRERGQRFE